MKFLSKYLKVKFLLIIYFLPNTFIFADNHNISEILENLQNDIKTLEKAVYSGSIELNSGTNNSSNTIVILEFFLNQAACFLNVSLEAVVKTDSLVAKKTLSGTPEAKYSTVSVPV